MLNSNRHQGGGKKRKAAPTEKGDPMSRRRPGKRERRAAKIKQATTLVNMDPRCNYGVSGEAKLFDQSGPAPHGRIEVGLLARGW